MRILLTPNLPRSVRALAHELLPASCTLEIKSPSHTDYDQALADAECLMGLPRVRIDGAFLARAPRLRMIQLLRTGHELIDLAATAKAGVQAATTGDVTAGIVAEHCLMLMLALSHKLRFQHDAVVNGHWLAVKPWQLSSGDVDSVPEVQFNSLAGQTLGILGVGAIGSRVARLARAFGMTVQGLAHLPGEQVRDDVPLVPLPALLETSDVISLHLRLSPETARIMNAEAFARMRRGSYLVNTARGELVDEDALAGALARGQLAGAALDTLQKEPPPPDHPLLGRPDVLFTPHTAWLTHDSWRRTLTFGFSNVERFLAGHPIQNLVRD
ncbi:MAG TPA: NAD(P)-dependent oxidoreductase [Kofleriaceae bacterium]|jgi:phosphoglycerate dehydrogenase-like enzyme|nr:NAD(P)-dependent oxidoreductase [Kofleriaceae bacterium]